MVNEPPATRADIERRWLDLADGRTTAGEVRDWALRHLEYGDDVEELVIQGLLALVSSDPTRDPDSARSARLAELARWRHELERYDADPVMYERERMQRMLIEFSTRHGAAKTERFARKLIRSGLLTASDVSAIRSRFMID